MSWTTVVSQAISRGAARNVDIDLTGGFDSNRRAFGCEDTEHRCRGLDVVGEADTEVSTYFSSARLLLAEGVVMEHVNCVLKYDKGIDVVVAHPVRVCVWHLVEPEEGSVSQLHRIDAHLAGCDVEHRPPERAFRIATALDIRNVQRCWYRRSGPESQRMAPGQAQGKRHRPSLRASQATALDMLPRSDTKSRWKPWMIPSSSNAIGRSACSSARLARRHQVLLPILDPLNRYRQLRGGEHEAHFLALYEDLLAEAAARIA